MACLLAALSGCATLKPRPPPTVVKFEPEVVTGDLELEKLNDEELFAQGSSAYAANDWKQAARYFDRLADFHQDSKHRRSALYNAGLAHERLEAWDAARERFAELADAARGQGDALDAAYRLAETLYHLQRFDEAAALLTTLAERTDVSWNKRIEAQVQKGVCELEAGKTDAAEATLRKAMAWHQTLTDKDEVDDYFPGQAQFFLGEIYRLHYETIVLDPEKGTDALAQDLEYKAELLLSAQGHYLRAIRLGNGYWATASGQRVGGMYENFYDHLINTPAPRELNQEESEAYRQELRKKIRVLITKAINIYERTLEAAERIGAQNNFVERTRESLRKMKELLVADAQQDDPAPAAAAAEHPDPRPAPPAAAPKGGKGRPTQRKF
ncbi:MAG TPA: tetratricopeptide repeat protein [Myxococcales bacterium]|nr:tetratricopeptide repeat protein [Myxococcales bacterium]